VGSHRGFFPGMGRDGQGWAEMGRDRQRWTKMGKNGQE